MMTTTTTTSSSPATTLRKALFALGFASLGAIGTLGLTAAAGHGPGGHDGHSMHRGAQGAKVMMMAISRLDLTEEQQAGLEQAKSDIVDQVRANRSELQDDRGELMDALRNGELSREDLHARVDERMASAAEDMHFGIDRLMDVYETLDADQKAELVDMLDQFQQRRSEGRSERRGDRGDRGFGGPDFDNDLDGDEIQGE